MTSESVGSAEGIGQPVSADHLLDEGGPRSRTAREWRRIWPSARAPGGSLRWAYPVRPGAGKACSRGAVAGNGARATGCRPGAFK